MHGWRWGGECVERRVGRAGANAMAISLARGRRVTLSKVDAFADGVAVKQVRNLIFSTSH